MYHDDLDRMLTTWIDDPASVPAPPYLGAVLERTRRTRQRPAWASLERWLPMSDKILSRPASPPMRIARLALIALVLVALAVGAAVVGSRLIKQGPALPQGGAAVFTFASIVETSAFGGVGGDIYTVQADGTNLRRLTAGDEVDLHPAFSPDGSRIAFRTFEDGTGNDSIVVMDAGGAGRKVLATSHSGTLDCIRSAPAWSPDGARLLFSTTESCTNSLGLMIVPADGAAPATSLLPAGMNGTLASWSPDGKRIAFLGSEGGGYTGVYVIDVDESGVPAGGVSARRVGPGSPGPLVDAISAPRWSPDGTEVAADNGAKIFAVGATDGFSIHKADGSGTRLDVPNGHNPEWSPDGRRLAFHRQVDQSEWFMERPCTVRMWVIDADGTDERRLDPLADGCGAGPTWSPDGTRLTGSLITSTATDPNPGFHVGVVTVDGSTPVVILPDGGAWSWQPVVAPLPAAPSFPVESPAS